MLETLRSFKVYLVPVPQVDVAYKELPVSARYQTFLRERALKTGYRLSKITLPEQKPRSRSEVGSDASVFPNGERSELGREPVYVPRERDELAKAALLDDSRASRRGRRSVSIYPVVLRVRLRGR